MEREGVDVVQIRLLGGVSASTASGEPIDVGPAKCQALLAALALSPGAALPVARLVDLVWGDEPPRTAEKTLQTYATRLRKGLGEAAIVRVGSAYQLDVAPDAVDVERFRRRVEAGSAAAALAEWSGTPLAGLDAPGLQAVVDGLVEQWLGAVEADLERQIDEEPAEAVARLTALTDEHPFRERLWALLMTALYRTGRQADALAAYRDARRRLVDELGVEPGPELRALEAAVLAQDPGLAMPAAPLRSSSEQPAAEQQSPRVGRFGNLPRRRPTLVGRDAELGAVVSALDELPVVTLVGPGGIGKTTLAIAAARAAQDERGGTAWLVELAEVTSSAEVARAAANVVHVSQGPGESLIDAIVGALEHRQAVLVLDNAEHVLDGVAELASAIADGCGEVVVLVTSRERLGIDVEQVIAVPPLDPAGAAVELFAARARATSGGFDLDACRPEVEEVCRRLDGIPLAIELAAARTTALSTAELLERLDDQQGLLAGGRPRGGDRHRTLRAAIQWSTDLLSPEERRTLARLAVFSGPFDLAAVETVAADATLTPAGVDAAVAGLVDRSVLATEQGPFGRRFRLLEVIRRFALEHLAADEALGTAEEHHTRWVLAQVERIGRMLTGWEEIEAVDRLSELWPNLRAAVDRAIVAGDAALARDLVAPVAPEVFLRSQSEIADWVERILEVADGSDEELVAWGLTWASRRAMRNRDPDAYQRLVDRHGEPDDPLVHHARAFVAQDQEALLRWCPPCADELRHRGEDHLAQLFEIGSARALLSMGRDAEGDELLRPLLDRFRRDGPPTFLNWALSMLGYAAMRQGRRDDAETLFEEAVAVTVPAGTHSRNKPILARAALRRGDRHEALRLLRSYVGDLIELDDLHETRTAAADLVLLATSIGRRQAVARLRRHLEAPDGEPGLDDRRALRHMADVLDQLVAEG